MREKVVLLVEDNPDDRDLTLRAFARYHQAHAIDLVEDGQQAIDYLLSPSADGALRPLPKVVLLDLNLPRVDGLEVLRCLRLSERTRLLPVVILTSSAEEEDIVQGYSLGANSYVRKPVSFTEFAEVARELGVYWLELNELPEDRMR